MSKKHFNFLVIIWILAIVISCSWNYSLITSNNRKLVLNKSRSFFEQILITRLWNSNHGGVYVPITDTTTPNIYLKDTLRDVVTTDGMKLTKINPAYMTRQISELIKTHYDLQFHITSLNPIRPENKANKWETDALNLFEGGTKEILELIREDSILEYRYMAPLITERSCLKCHQQQGYNIGDIRGGISISFPAKIYSKGMNNQLISFFINAFILVLGITVIVLFYGKLKKYFNLGKIQNEKLLERTQDLIEAKEKAEESEKSLKERVKELNGIQSLSQLVEKYEKNEHIFSEFINSVLPKSMQYPDKVYALLEIGNQKYCSNNDFILEKNKKYLQGDIKESNKITGKLIVTYTEDLPFIEHYEQSLIDVYSERISMIIERKKGEYNLLKAKEKAEESDRLKSAFLTNMSHEIRTPMNGILGFTNLLKEPGLTGEKQKEYIRIIGKSGDRMLNTINDIMDISIIESGQVNISISEVNINEQTENLLLFFKHEAEKKGLQLSLNNSLVGKEAIIKTDLEKVYSILTNLIKNALKYTHEGSIEFGYNKKINDASSELEFFVKDTGIGIRKNRQSSIFDRFVQADINDKMALEGSGLGLSIAKAYVEMLGGKIWVESKEGVGSQFYFTIPYITMTRELPESIEPEYPVKPTSKIKKLKILIVEDEEISELYLAMILEKFKKEILYARTGVEALESCRMNTDIDLVLMDIRMPDMDGYEATRRIREFNKDVIIIAQTAFAEPGDREKSIKAGCDGYITKPINKEKLYTIINKTFAELT